MKILDLKLSEIFKPRSLKPYTTKKQCATPAEGSLCYVWNDGLGSLKTRLSEGSIFRPGGNSVNNLIHLSDRVYGICSSYCIIVGPNTNTKTQTIRFISNGEETRILFNGWGSSCVLLWEGRTSYLMRYLRDNQPIIEGGKMEYKEIKCKCLCCNGKGCSLCAQKGYFIEEIDSNDCPDCIEAKKEGYTICGDCSC